MWFIILSIISAIPLILFWIDRKWSEEDAKLNLPGPKAYPIIGSLFEMWSFISSKKSKYLLDLDLELVNISILTVCVFIFLMSSVP